MLINDIVKNFISEQIRFDNYKNIQLTTKRIKECNSGVTNSMIFDELINLENGNIIQIQQAARSGKLFNNRKNWIKRKQSICRYVIDILKPEYFEKTSVSENNWAITGDGHYIYFEDFTGTGNGYSNVSITGHSLGGHLAALLGVVTGNKATIFNAPGYKDQPKLDFSYVSEDGTTENTISMISGIISKLFEKNINSQADVSHIYNDNSQEWIANYGTNWKNSTPIYCLQEENSVHAINEICTAYYAYETIKDIANGAESFNNDKMGISFNETFENVYKAYCLQFNLAYQTLDYSNYTFIQSLTSLIQVWSETQKANGGAIKVDSFNHSTSLSMTGTDGADIIYTGGGNVNDISLGGGDDIYVGGLSKDLVSATSGDNLVILGAGSDTYIGGSGADVVDGGSGSVIKIKEDLINAGYTEVAQLTMDKLKDNTNDTNTIHLEAGNDVYTGGVGIDIVYSGQGNDTINTGGNNDIVYTDDSTDSNDVNTLVGGKGNDSLDGGSGNDIYIYNLGDGFDTISDSSGTDKIKFGEGISFEDLSFENDNNNLTVYVNEDKTQGFKINDYFSGSYGIETLEFADGSTVDLTQIGLTFQQHDGSETITGTKYDDVIYANGGDDTVNADSGNDTIYGGTGNDTLNGQNGNDTLIGGIGNDTLNGGAGDDTYIYNLGDGYDIISDSSGNDKIKFGEGIPFYIWYINICFFFNKK